MSQAHTLLELIESVKDSIPEGKYLEIANSISEIYKKAEFTPHRIVYAVPTISHGTNANITDHLHDDCDCTSYMCRGELDCTIKSLVWPYVKVADIPWFNRVGDKITIPIKLPVKVHPVVLDMNLYETISLVSQTDVGEDIPECDVKSLKLSVGTALILSVTPL